MEDFFQLIVLIEDLFGCFGPVTLVGFGILDFIEFFIVEVRFLINGIVCRLGALLLPLVGALSCGAKNIVGLASMNIRSTTTEIL